MKHRNIRSMMYEYLRGELAPDVRKEVALHVATCTKCADEMRILAEVVDVTRMGAKLPSAALGDAYWKSFSNAVDSRVQSKEHPSVLSIDFARDAVRELFFYRRRSVGYLAAGLALGVLYGVVMLRPSWPTTTEPSTASVQRVPATPVVEVDRMQKYFRKSKTLLVGIENMKAADHTPTDFSTEREASRELLMEARYLKYQPLDNRSAKLIGDLEKILIELSTLKEETGLPNVEIVRGGIHQENLLFKIRMAEALYDTSRYNSDKNEN